MKAELAPFYQGQLDVFCAAYAVLNALRFMYRIRPLEGRELLHEALLDAVDHPETFRELLDQRTDYTGWVDSILKRRVHLGGLHVEIPFPPAPEPAICSSGSETDASPVTGASVPDGRSTPGPAQVWETLVAWISSGTGHCALFQFIRFLPVQDARIRHWTCCGEHDSNELALYDCSRERSALKRIARSRLITDEAAREAEKVLVVPHTIRLLRPKLPSAGNNRGKQQNARDSGENRRILHGSGAGPAET